MGKRTVVYRGSLKSCNYSCSYCPFSKHRATVSETERDRQGFERFCRSAAARAQDFSIGAVLITPYGEASVYPWYWEGLSRLAGIPGIDRVGLQTNLSFSVEECLKIYDSVGGGIQGNVPSDEYALWGSPLSQDGVPEASEPGAAGDFRLWKRGKLCIWATFHPEMTTVDEFVSRCHSLSRNHVKVCAGAVGVPRNIQLIWELREKLSPEIYLWINRMDGLKRNYSREEVEDFLRADPFFEYELRNPDADARMCADRCFVEADGRVHTCNISRPRAVNWYDAEAEEIFEPECSRKTCSCYLAYGGRADFTLRSVFGGYPLFRLPGVENAGEG